METSDSASNPCYNFLTIQSVCGRYSKKIWLHFDVPNNAMNLERQLLNYHTTCCVYSIDLNTEHRFM